MANFDTATLSAALAEAASSHHGYETGWLHGKRDPNWVLWYAGFLIGKFGQVAAPGEIVLFLIEADKAGLAWPDAAAAHIHSRIFSNG